MAPQKKETMPKRQAASGFVGPLPKGMTRKAPKSRQPRVASAAAAYAVGLETSEPRFTARTARGTRIVHREMIASLTGSATFTIANDFALNPGIAATFPWLSTQATSWEQYILHRVKFCYYARCPTSTPGSVFLIPDYDAADAAPSTEQIASTYRGTVEKVAWTPEFSLTLDRQSMHQPAGRKYIRTGPLASNLDIKTYDSGQVFVSTNDGTAVSWGKLWVEYDVEFFNPQLQPTGSINQVSQHLTSSTPTTANMLPSPTTLAGSTTIATVSGEVITFALPGRFLITYYATATTSIGNSGYPTGGAGLVLVTTYASPNGVSIAGSTTPTFMESALVNTPVGGTLTFNNTIVSGLTAELIIAGVPVGQT